MMESHNYDKALEYLKDAEKLDPLNKEIYMHKGLCFLEQVIYIIYYFLEQTRSSKKRI